MHLPFVFAMCFHQTLLKYVLCYLKEDRNHQFTYHVYSMHMLCVTICLMFLIYFQISSYLTEQLLVKNTKYIVNPYVIISHDVHLS